MDRESLRLHLSSDEPLGPDALYRFALNALDHGLEANACERLTTALVSYPTAYRLWQVLGLAKRAMLDATGAHTAFQRAAELSPKDALIAHSTARTAMEAGLPASRLYARARTLAPADGDVLLGESVAMRAEGEGDLALNKIATVLFANPGWIQGHAGYARLAAASRRDGEATKTVDEALNRFPRDQALLQCKCRIQIAMRDHRGACVTAKHAIALFGANESWTRTVAGCLSEIGEANEAQLLFDRLPDAQRAADLIHPIRTLIRLQRYDAATALAERRFGVEEERSLWPYRSLLWRLQGDTRWEWLEGDDRLIGSYDLRDAIDDLAELADTLRTIHARSGEMHDQSVRGGTQTDGHLLARGEPAIRRLHDTLTAAVAAHVAQLPAARPDHPTLVERRVPLHFSGAWSIRLQGSGFHVDHVHPQGWLSSAFYVTVPDTDTNEAAETSTPSARPIDMLGWLALGECRELVPTLEGFRFIEPKLGRLVMFPSTMWHGTRPFSTGERMTVALDVAYPEAGH